ncbi:MAG: TolC family protein [Thermodesulfobacteriota bacterium]
MKKIISLLVAVLSFSATCIGFAEEPALQVELLVKEALAASPKIIAAREKYAALQERVPQAGALEDPMLEFGVINLPDNFDFGAEDMTMKEISVSQKLPFPGKRDLSREAAAREADAGAAEIEEIANQVEKEVKTAFYDLSHVYRAMEVTRRNKGILEELSRITQARYSLGMSIQEDIIRIQVEISKMLDELIMLEQQKASLAAKLNFILNRPPDRAVGLPAAVEFRPAAFSIAELQQQALAENPMLRTLTREIAARSKAVELARRDFFPDFNLRLAYGQRDDRRDTYTGTVEMNLPVFYKSKSERKVAETGADVRSLQAKYDNARNELLYMIADMGSMTQRLERKIALYRTGIIPQALLQFESAVSAYKVNKADFMTLLDSRMRLYRYELDFHEALTEYEKNLAGLEAAVGSTFSREVKQ